MPRVNIKRKVDYENLVTALKKAAEDFDWDVEVEDKYKPSYVLGSVQEVEEYDSTEIKFTTKSLSRFLRKEIQTLQAEVTTYSKEDPRQHFYIEAKEAPESQIVDFLSTVSNNLGG